MTDAVSTHAVALRTSSLRDYLQIIRRRLWIAVLATVLVPVAAVAVSVRQQAMYAGTAQVLLAQGDLTNELTGTQDTSSATPADRRAQTQADLARVPAVAVLAVRSAHAKLSADKLLKSSSVSAATNADLLTFSVSNHDPALASRLATAYANAYVRYRLAGDIAPIENALSAVEQQIAASAPRGALHNSLVDKATQLRTMAALKTANASVVRDAQKAVQTAPKVARNGVLGLLLGLFLGVALAFLRDTLDTRVRTSEEISGRLGLALLARLPQPPRKLRTADRLAMLSDPRGPQAEAFRMLRTNLEFATLGREAHTIMVTSAIETEGKSTTVANLAVAFARAGQRVALVDLDLRRPFVGRFFDIPAHQPGVTQVALGSVSLDDALVAVPLTAADTTPGGANNGAGASNGNGHRPVESILHVLPAGAIPPDPGEFMATDRLTEILHELVQRTDVVLIDAPPLFHVGDGMALSAKVDAAIVITRLDVMRQGMLTELGRLLERMPTHKLGFVLTGVKGGDGYGYGYGSGYTGYYATASSAAASSTAAAAHKERARR